MFTVERAISQCLACEFPPLKWLLLNFYERLLGLSLCDENFTQSEMDKGSLRVQVYSFFHRGLGFIVSAPHVQQVRQARIRIGTKGVERDRLLIKPDGLVEIAQYPGSIRTNTEDFNAPRFEGRCFGEGSVGGVPIPIAEDLRSR